MRRKAPWLACIAIMLLIGCEAKIPKIADIRDSRLFDRRIEETARQKAMRECQQESDRFRVDCTHCHTTKVAEEIIAPDALKLNDIGNRARIMRTSATFGLQQQCSKCHQSKFALNSFARRQFGPGSERHKEIEELMGAQSIK